MTLGKLTFCCWLATFGWVVANEEFTLDIPQGSLTGLKTTTIYHRKLYYSFKGIPYAKPNVGPNKFRLPEPADSWNGVLDATQHRSTCVFYCMIRKEHFGHEDCLYLNVYTPNVDREAKMAVMVFIHGGGFNMGSGNDDVFGPDFLVEKDIVLVTLNYRLGAIGFLNTGDANAPGNAGLKDQVMALRWVRDNIEHFGGSAQRVTIFGQSAGSASVQYHMLSPMSQGLFANAITQSGTTAAGWSYTQTPKEWSFKLGEILGVKTTDTAELVNKLKDFSAEELVDASAELAAGVNRLNGFMKVFLPSSEADVGQDIFLPDNPWELIKSGKIADVPLMNGLTADEFIFAAGALLSDPKMVDVNFDLFIPDDLNMTDLVKRKEIGESIKKFYFDGHSVSTNAQKGVDLLSDVGCNYGGVFTTKIINSRNSAPVYEYLFTFYGPIGFLKTLYGVEEGVSHSDELIYQFYSEQFKNEPIAGQPAEKMIDIMTELWTNFAKESNPTPNMDGVVKVKWEPKGQEDNYLEINVEPTMKKAMMKDRMTFWADIYKNVLGDYSKLFA